jgi:hypothetical protein
LQHLCPHWQGPVRVLLDTRKFAGHAQIHILRTQISSFLAHIAHNTTINDEILFFGILRRIQTPKNNKAATVMDGFAQRSKFNFKVKGKVERYSVDLVKGQVRSYMVIRVCVMTAGHRQRTLEGAERLLNLYNVDVVETNNI